MNLRWNKERLAKLKSLYDSGLSMREVAEKLTSTIWAINNAMWRYGIARRKVFETKRIQFDRSPLSFNEKTKLIKDESESRYIVIPIKM